MYEGEVEGLPYLLDIEQALEKAELTEREREVIEKMQIGMHPNEIGNQVGLLGTNVYRELNKGISKLTKELKE